MKSRKSHLLQIFKILCREDIRFSFLRRILVRSFIANYRNALEKNNISTDILSFLRSIEKEMSNILEKYRIYIVNNKNIETLKMRELYYRYNIDKFIILATPGLIREILLLLMILKRENLDDNIKIVMTTTYTDSNFVNFMEKFVESVTPIFKNISFIHKTSLRKGVISSYLLEYLYENERKGLETLYDLITRFLNNSQNFVLIVPAVPLYILSELLRVMTIRRDRAFIGSIRAFFERDRFIMFIYSLSQIIC